MGEKKNKKILAVLCWQKTAKGEGKKNQFELGSAACARETFGATEINLVGEGKQSGKTREGERREPNPTPGESGPGLGCAGSFRKVMIINYCFLRTQMKSATSGAA